MESFNSTSNDSQSVLEAACYRYDKHWVRTLRISPYVVIFLFAVIGNTVVLAVVYRNKTMRKTINFFIANMAFSDLIFTVISVPRVVTIVSFGYKWLVHGTLGMIFCRMIPFVMEITIIISVLNIVAISLERLLAVLFPLRTFIRKKPCLLSIFGMWLIAIIVKIPTPLATDVHPFQGETYCVVDFDLTFGAGSGRIYFKIVFVALYAVPFAVTFVFNIAVIAIMNRRGIPGNSVSDAACRRREKTNRKVLRMVLVVVAAFLICWSLYFILIVLRKNGIHVSCNVLYLRLLLAHFNAALTPFLYAVFSENYRQGFEEILSCRWLRCHRVSDKTNRDVKPDVNDISSRRRSSVNHLRSSVELRTLRFNSTDQLLN